MNTQKIYFIFSEDHHREMRRIFAAHNKPETVKKPQGINKACISSFIEKKADTEKIERVSGTVEEAPKKRQSKKQDFFISVYDKKAGQTVKKVSGHVLLVDGLEMGLHKNRYEKNYTITDLVSGFAVGNCKTIKDVFTELKPELITLIKKKHTEKDVMPFIERIQDAYLQSDFN